MKKKTPPQGARNLDKHLFEAGQQCQKRLWLDYHEPVEEEPSPLRQAMSAAGDQLRTLARTAFPKGVAIAAKDYTAAAAETKERIAAGSPVLFDAAFVADGVEVRSDILVLHKDGQCDLFEIKSGTKVKHRYVNDLALQAHVLALSGLKMRAAYLLHVNPRYVHKEGADFPPMQLLRSSDVTAKVTRQVDAVRRRLQQYRQTLGDEAALQLPMGTFCTNPFPCPHLARCGKEAPKLPLRELPELTRQQEVELHKEGIEDLAGVDAARPGLTFRQRRVLTCVQQGTPSVEPFVREELRQCGKPLHFLAIASVTDPLPRFDGQRPWRLVPWAWAANTLHEDGRIERASFVHVERSDPRPAFAEALHKHLEVGGTLLVWNDENLEELRTLLDDLPAAKAAVRGLVGQQHIDLMQLFDAGVFHPALRSHADLRASVQALLGDASGKDLTVWGEDAILAALQKAQAPRVRATTKEKIGAEILATLTWTVEQLQQLFTAQAGADAAPQKPKVAVARPATKSLPKPLPEPE
ncbi:MAG: DUF2779 domain-containing protein [Planctomycetota bacterium]